MYRKYTRSIPRLKAIAKRIKQETEFPSNKSYRDVSWTFTDEMQGKGMTPVINPGYCFFKHFPIGRLNYAFSRGV